MKLYLVVRRDLSPGARAAQLCHALRAFAEAHPDVDRDWYERSNTLVLLETHPERLPTLLEVARKAGVPSAGFWEPDLGDQLTAVAVGPAGRRLVRDLPLALVAP